jgi:hypothetical protein
LSCFDESLVVPKYEAQGEKSEQIREYKVQREIRIGI